MGEFESRQIILAAYFMNERNIMIKFLYNIVKRLIILGNSNTDRIG